MKLINTIVILISLSIVFASGCAVLHSAWNYINKPKDTGPVYESFKWCYGGFNGAGAVTNGVIIADLATSKNAFTFRYVVDMSAWDHPAPDHAEIACLFLKNNAGEWVGGKFDWVRNSDKMRDLNHIIGATPYNGWSLAGIPNPCEMAFVIVEGNSKRRSNVLVAEWRR